MTISEIEVQDRIKFKGLREEVYSIGVGELELWKKAVKADKKLFDQLFQSIFSDDQRLSWRSAWIIDSASEDYPELIEDLIPEIIDALINTKNGSLKRHFTRILGRFSIPEQYLGVCVNRCFELLTPLEPPAVRVNAMQVLYNISQQIPDLKGELILVIENLLEEGGSAGFRNRSEKLLRKLRL